MSDFTLEELFNYRRHGAGKLVDAYEQQQAIIAKLETALSESEHERLALAVHVERLRTIAFPYVDFWPELVDWFNDTPHQSLAERDAVVIIQAVNKYKLRVMDGPDIYSDALIEYANQLKRGES